MLVALPIIDGDGNPKNIAAEQTGSLLATHSVPEVGGAAVTAQNPLPTTPGVMTAAPPNAFAVVSGGVPVEAFGPSAIEHGAYITNPDDAEFDMFVDPVSPPMTLASPGPNGTTSRIVAGQTWVAPGPMTGAVYVNAQDSGHLFVAVSY